MRNFEIVASSSQEAGKFRLTAIVIYVAPALAVNGVAVAWIAASRIGGAALLVAAVYAAMVLFSLGFLSIVSWTELQRVLGGLMAGFGCSLAGVLALLMAGVMLLREPAARPGS